MHCLWQSQRDLASFGMKILRVQDAIEDRRSFLSETVTAFAVSSIPMTPRMRFCCSRGIAAAAVAQAKIADIFTLRSANEIPAVR